MAGPKCDKCGKGYFSYEKVSGSNSTYLIYCTSCGHIVGVIYVP
jgi:hypothetical protein